MMVLCSVYLLSVLHLPVSAAEFGGLDSFPQSLSAKYTIERRFSTEDRWSPVASFELFQSAPEVPARLKNLATSRRTVTEEERKQLGVSADLLYYRVISTAPNAETGKSVPTVVLSPCSIIRGFSVLGKTTLLLTERFNVVLGTGTEVLGLQVSSTTNLFHSSIDGGSCDRSIVVNVFPEVEIEAEVIVVSSLPVRGVNYKELAKITREGDPTDIRKKVKGEPKKPFVDRRRYEEEEEGEDYMDTEDYVDQGDPTRGKRHKGKDGGEDVQEEKPEPTFFQKYWMFFVLPFVFSMIRGGASGASQARGAQRS